MNTERATDFLLRRLLKPNSGHAAFIEVGLGSCDWSFGWASRMGLDCIAVEPVPVPELRNACMKYGVKLIEAAAGSQPGSALLYRGELNGSAIPDTSSLNADWWAVGAGTVQTDIVTLGSVLAVAGVDQIACLKVDVEGTEAEVLTGLAELRDVSLPDFVAFEYGGGGTKGSGLGGWSPKGLNNTCQCLKMLADRGYNWGVLCERTLSSPRQFELTAASAKGEDLFPSRAEVGNMIVGRSGVPEQFDRWVESFRRRDKWRGLADSLRSIVNRYGFQFRRYRGAVLRRLRG